MMHMRTTTAAAAARHKRGVVEKERKEFRREKESRALDPVRLTVARGHKFGFHWWFDGRNVVHGGDVAA